MIRRITLAAALLLQGPALGHHTGRPAGATMTATVYDSWYSNRPAYCGGTYRHWGISAAHAWLPCGTRVRVSHHGRSLTVPITDRCECSSIDLSAGAAHRLGVPLDGIAQVRVTY